MKLSRNVIFAQEGSDSFIAACTLTRSVIRLNTKAKIDLERGDSKKLDELSLNDFQSCVDMKFLVDDDLNEQNWLSYILNKDRLSPHNLTTYVAFSTGCNFGCVYCYELGQVKIKTMTEEMIDKVVMWHKRKFEMGSYKVCHLHLYGGEPLMFKPLIFKLLHSMDSLTKEMGIQLDVRLITNGYLLTPKIIRQLLIYNLSSIHVTLDGDRDVHNQRRPLKNGDGTFDIVLENLLRVSAMKTNLEIECRISIDESNITDISGLLDTIKEKDIAGNIEPYFGFITQTSSQTINPESFCSQFVLEDEGKVKAILKLYKEAKKRDFSIPDFFTLGPCMAIADEAGVIDPEGNVFKCLDMIGCDSLIVDNVDWEEPNSKYFEFMRSKQLDDCLSTDCPFVPVCGIGCIMEAYLKTGDYKNKVCHRPMLEKIYQGLLPLQFS